MQYRNITKDALIGFAVGDALGVPVEFLSRQEVREIHLTDMLGNEFHLPFKSSWSKLIPSGSWSDDTSMLIAGMDSIIRNNYINYQDIMQSFCNWWDLGYYCSLDMPFGLDGIVSEALQRFQNGCPALECGGSEFYDNGNGALMRILPFSLYAIKTNMTESNTADLIAKASSITHAHDISKMSCFIYTEFLRNIILGLEKRIAFENLLKINYNHYFSDEAIKAHEKILNPDFLAISNTEISEDNGYVVASLESVLYSILTSNNYKTAVLKAINMGYDTDTIGGITGSIAGILYGYETIPKKWLYALRKRADLEELANQFEKLFEV
ncbi:MAG: ADP-ribosylglycohydrolase family protein [Oscillospiraceae bacterium]|nr:ADP-ribosylglycohydrolase family protein [Oscillospiraceae bacterium]